MFFLTLTTRARYCRSISALPFSICTRHRGDRRSGGIRGFRSPLSSWGPVRTWPIDFFASTGPPFRWMHCRPIPSRAGLRRWTGATRRELRGRAHLHPPRLGRPPLARRSPVSSSGIWGLLGFPMPFSCRTFIQALLIRQHRPRAIVHIIRWRNGPVAPSGSVLLPIGRRHHSTSSSIALSRPLFFLGPLQP